MLHVVMSGWNKISREADVQAEAELYVQDHRLPAPRTTASLPRWFAPPYIPEAFYAISDTEDEAVAALEVDVSVGGQAAMRSRSSASDISRIVLPNPDTAVEAGAAKHIELSGDAPEAVPSGPSEQSVSRLSSSASATAGEAISDMRIDLVGSDGEIPGGIQSASHDSPRYDPLRPFSEARIIPHQCLARIEKDGVVRQCGLRPKSGADLCFRHSRNRGKLKARYGLVTEFVPSSMVGELTAKLNLVANATTD